MKNSLKVSMLVGMAAIAFGLVACGSNESDESFVPADGKGEMTSKKGQSLKAPQVLLEKCEGLVTKDQLPSSQKPVVQLSKHPEQYTDACSSGNEPVYDVRCLALTEKNGAPQAYASWCSYDVRLYCKAKSTFIGCTTDFETGLQLPKE